MPTSSYQLLADAVLALHFAVVLFIVGGVVLVVAGNRVGWAWVNAPWFRFAHLAAVAFVVVTTWIGVACPLTTLENWLRAQAGSPTYSESFIEHWLTRFLFYQGPPWAFAIAYTLFGLLVAVVWWRFPPRRRPRPQH